MMQAFYLVEAGYKVEVFETSDRLGGLLGSHNKDGFLVEQAANAFIANYELERVADKISVPLVRLKASAKKRFIYKNGKNSRWPLSFSESMGPLAFVFKKIFNSKAIEPRKGETLQQWSDRCLGRAATASLFEPAMQGVFAARAEQLDAGLVVGSLFNKVKKGKLKGSVSPRQGMQAWIDGLVKFLDNHGVKFHLNFDSQNWQLAGEPWILATPLEVIKKLVLQKKLPLSDQVLKTQSASLSSVVLCSEGDDNPNPEGFGCLFPYDENFSSLGVLFNQNIFPDRVLNGYSETWIFNADQIDLEVLEEKDLLELALKDRLRLSANNKEPDHYFVNKWIKRIPLYNSALADLQLELDKVNEMCLFVGNYCGNLGLSKILMQAQSNVEKIEGGCFG